MIIKSYSQFIKIHEWHESGADAPEETLERTINNMLNRGFDKENIKSWIRKIIDSGDIYSIMMDVRKTIDQSLRPLAQPEEIQIIYYLYNCIETIFDDGYSSEDIYSSLGKIYNEMK
jgi:DNA-binding transcriptional regulator YhcF (GntR family)